VGDLNATRLQVLNLSHGFGLDLLGADAASEHAAEEDREASDKEIRGRVEQRSNLSGREDRFAIGEDNVAADAEG
jgi:hypothetical protein